MKIVIQRPKTEPREPTPEQARGWLNQRTGKYYKAFLIEEMEDIKDNWASGMYTGQNIEETIQLNSEAIGRVQQIAEILLKLDEMTENEPDEQNIED